MPNAEVEDLPVPPIPLLEVRTENLTNEDLGVVSLGVRRLAFDHLLKRMGMLSRGFFSPFLIETLLLDLFDLMEECLLHNAIEIGK